MSKRKTLPNAPVMGPSGQKSTRKSVPSRLSNLKITSEQDFAKSIEILKRRFSKKFFKKR